MGRRVPALTDYLVLLLVRKSPRLAVAGGVSFLKLGVSAAFAAPAAAGR